MPSVHQAEMFSNLVFSAPCHRPLQSAPWMGFSTVLHVLVVLVVAREATRATEAQPEAMVRESVTYVDLVEQPLSEGETSEARPSAPVLPETTAVEVTRPDLSAGFQELSLPAEMVSIPEPSHIRIQAEDFGGRGTVGGVAGGRPVPRYGALRGPASEVVPRPVSVAVVDEPPRILNLDEISKRIQELYTFHFLTTDIGAQVVVQFVVDANGWVEKEGLTVVSATHRELEGPTLSLTPLMRWRPAQHNGQPVRVWIRLPVSWEILR